jgi:hypothetical protein
MSKYVVTSSPAEAWVVIMEYLLGEPDGKCFNLITAIADPSLETKAVTRVVDALAAETGTISTMENANAIWPYVLAPPGQDVSVTIQKMKEFAVPLIKSANAAHRDSYLQRLVAWRSKESGSEVPQLERVIERMRSELNNPAPKTSVYEVAIFSPGLDPGYISFPCLSHLSLKLDLHLRRVHLTAVYRNHHFIGHGYGNFLGLGRLLRFVATQVGLEPGELVCVSTHADAELSRGLGRIRKRVAEARAALKSPAALDIDSPAHGSPRSSQAAP